MKLVTLNLWGGRVAEKYKEFFEKYSDVNVWCFQEVYKGIYEEGDEIDRSKVDFNLYETLQGYLNGFQSEFCQFLKNVWGIVAFLDKNIRIVERGETLIARGDYEDMSDMQNRDMHRKAQWLEVEIKGKKVLIVNTHLTHRPAGKVDSKKRLNQSKIIVDLLNLFDCPKILVGDFNLLPDTESIKIIEKSGMKNLIKEYAVTSTRTELYKKELRLADYIFVSPEIKVKDFKVLPDVVSDHSPLYLDFEIV